MNKNKQDLKSEEKTKDKKTKVVILKSNSKTSNSNTNQPQTKTKKTTKRGPKPATIKKAYEIWDIYFPKKSKDGRYFDFAGVEIKKEEYVKGEWDRDHIIPKSKCNEFKKTNLISNFSQNHKDNLQPTSKIANQAKGEKLNFLFNGNEYKVYFNKDDNEKISKRKLFCGKVSEYNEYVKKGVLIDVELELKKLKETTKVKPKKSTSSKIKNNKTLADSLIPVEENKPMFVNSLFSHLNYKFSKKSYSVIAFSIKFTDSNFFNFFIRLKEILSIVNYGFNNFLVNVKSKAYFLHIYSERFVEKTNKVCPETLVKFIKLIVEISKIKDFENYVCKQFLWACDFDENQENLHEEIGGIWEKIPHLFWTKCIENQQTDKFYINERIKEILSEYYQVNTKSLDTIGKWYKLDERFFKN